MILAKHCIQNWKNIMYEIKRFIFEPLQSNMYLILENNKALIIDPCVSQEVCKILIDRHIKNISVILTHEHFDHISGIPMLKENFEIYVTAHKDVNKIVSDSCNRITSRYASTFIGRDQETLQIVKDQCKRQIVFSVDRIFEKSCDFMWGEHSLHLVNTPGHTPGSICIILDHKYLFTGDSLIPEKSVVTRFVGGNMKSYQEMTIPFLNSLDKELIVFPGHGESMKLGEMLC